MNNWVQVRQITEDEFERVNEPTSSEPSVNTEGLLSFPTLPLDSTIYLQLFEQLRSSIPWQEDSFTAFDRSFSIPRLQAWFADNGLQYRYANNLLKTQAWIEPLLQLRRIVENTTGHDFNAVLATLYRNGEDHVTWHADDERELGAHPVIASLSLGATRCFQFRHKRLNKKGEIYLAHGDFLIMESPFQKYWEHQVPIEKHITQCRINLTFRKVLTSGK